MKFNTQIGCAVDESASRYALSNVVVTTKGDAVATDGRVMAVAKVDGEIPKTIFVSGAPKTRTDVGCEYVVKDGETRKTSPRGKVTVTPVAAGRFPRAYDVLPATDGGSVVVRVNAELLHNLAKAICDGKCEVSLIVDGKGGAIAVVGSAGIGVCMPWSAKECTAVKTYDSRRKELSYINEAIASLHTSA